MRPPRFLFMIGVGEVDGPPPLLKDPDFSQPWRWKGNKNLLVRFQGKVQRLERALYALYRDREPTPRQHVRRIPNTDPTDFRPQNFYLAGIGSAPEIQNDEQAEIFNFLEKFPQLKKLSDLAEEELEDHVLVFDSLDIKTACAVAGIEVDLKLPGDTR